MKVSSGVTSYLYDINRSATQRRGADDVSSNSRSNYLLEGQREEKIHAPVEQVVEGEVLNGYHGDEIERVLNYSQAQQYDAAPDNSAQQSENTTRANYAAEQYQTIGLVDDQVAVLSLGRRVDYYA